MSQIQKVIRYLAIAFAFFLIFGILSCLMYGFSFMADLLDDEPVNTEELKNLEVSENALLLDIDIVSSNIIIKEGDSFQVETNNSNITTKQHHQKLYIKEEQHSWFSNRNDTILIIFIPSDYIFDKVTIESGAGKVNIETLATKSLYLDLGAGKVEMNDLTVLEDAEIDGGAGEINIRSGSIHNLDLDMGIGKLSLTSKLTGINKINTGIGKVEMFFIGTLEDYQIKLDKDLGTATIDGNNMSSNTYYGTGDQQINIDGGIGKVQILFVEEDLKKGLEASF